MTAKVIELPKGHHRYNDPLISPKDFLLEVMRDHNTELSLRIKAASMAVPLTAGESWPSRTVTCTIKVPTLQ
jgi:hypothetical protein